MTDRKLPLSINIKLTKEGLKNLSIAEKNLTIQLAVVEDGVSQMYDSLEKTRAIERLGELETDLENVREKKRALADWLKSVRGA